MAFSALSLSTFYVKNLKHRKIKKIDAMPRYAFFPETALGDSPAFRKKFIFLPCPSQAKCFIVARLLYLKSVLKYLIATS